MLEREVRISNPLGLHARASAQLVRLANEFQSEIRLIRDDTGVEADAKSILDVMHVAAAFEQAVRITTNGPDENEALTRIGNLLEGHPPINEEG